MSFSKGTCILDIFHKHHSFPDDPYNRESWDSSAVFVMKESVHLQRELLDISC